MENKNKKKRSNKNYLLFISLILLITIGFALLTQDLFISGSSQLKDSKWNIHWDNVVVNENSVKGDAVTTAAQITNTEKTLVEYSISLSKPGDYYEFTVDAKNEGTIDGMVNVVSNKVYESNGTTEKTLPEYLTYTVTYSDGKAIEPKHLLSAGSTEKYKVRVEFKDVAADKLPSQNETLKFKFEVEYVQADDSAQAVTHGLTGTRYTTNKYDTSKPDNNYVRLNQTMPSHITFHETVSAAKSAFNNSPCYLKHAIENDIVKESYVCFERNSNTYCLRGGENESSLSEKPIYESNKEVLQSAFASSWCSSSSSYFHCGDGLLYAIAISDGEARAHSNSDDRYCTVDSYGNSNCDE